MKRNWTALALVLGLTLALTACGGDPGATETPGSAASIDSQTSAAESDLDYVKGNGVLKIGYAPLEPMNYPGEDGELTGFETKLATAVRVRLGVKPKFVEINWDVKLPKLESRDIDCIWNGMTITPEFQEAISISDPYIKNYQAVVVRAADVDKYTSTESLASANLDAKAGSVGEAVVAAGGFLSQVSYISVVKQTDALLKVKSGAADAAAMDFVLVSTLIGTGDYSDPMVIPGLELPVEEYGIGFRQSSDPIVAVNQATQELIGDGTLNELTVKYELVDLLLANQ